MEHVLRHTLAAAPDQETKEAIQASQDRWLAMMGEWDTEATRAALATVRGEPSDTIAENGSFEAQLANTVAYRARSIPGVLENLSAAKNSLARLSALAPPGLAVSSDTSCFFAEPEVLPTGHWDSFCGGIVSLQKGTRVCSAMSYWYSEHINTVFSVDDLVDGALTHRGNCDWNGPAPDCPDADDGSDANQHWDSHMSRDVAEIHSVILNAREAARSPLWPIDPDGWPDVYPDDWFETCLTTTDYPPPDQLWAGNGPKP